MSVMAESKATQSANWEGCIPILLTLSSSSLSAPTLPPPIHVFVARHNYLHLALEEAVRKLNEFAPMTLNFSINGGIMRNEEPHPGTAFQDDDDQEEEYSAKTSSDLSSVVTATTATTSSINSNILKPYPICWFEDEDSQTALRWHLFAGVLYDMKPQPQQRLPWKIRLHFNSYPSNQILSLESGSSVVEQVRQYYKNSLKQALCIQVGNSKAAMNLTKENHGRLWDAIRRNNYELYRQALQQALSKHETTRIPIRLLVDIRPPKQRPVVASSKMTLGEYLNQETEFFTISSTDSETNSKFYTPKSDSVYWRVAGLSKPPLEASLLELWLDLRHPDQFLHICVVSLE